MAHLEHFKRRQRPPRSPEGDHIVNDIGRLRQELRDALNETEQTKQSLKNLDDRIHSQISSDERVSVALPDHTRPYPLDAYLRATRDVPEELSTSKVEEDVQTKPKRESVVQEPPGLCAHAQSVLRDVQKQKENLEWNLMALSRRHDEQYLYNMVEDDETNSDALRIRNDVAKRIEEIDAAVQAELLLEEQQRALENQVSQDKSKLPKQTPRTTRGVPVRTEKRSKLRNVGKENAPSRAKTAAKPKISKPTAKQPAVKRPLGDITHPSRAHGRLDQVTRRTTSQPDQTRYKSPEAVKLKRTAAPTKRKIRSPPRLDESSSSTLSEDYRPPTSRAAKPRYYFQPNAGADQSVIEAHFRENQGPLPGQLLPMAIPLGKPRMDPALRLPLCIDEDVSRLPQTVTVSTDVKQPNVAVITLKDDEFLQAPDSGVKRQKKSIPKKRERLTLEKQILPNVDIDTSAVSEISSDASAKEINQPTILPIPHPLPRPDVSEYEEFRDYEHVSTIDDDEGSEKSSVHGGGSVISLLGENRTDKPAYQGPAFPPRNAPVDLRDRDGFQGTSSDLRIPRETVENKARELIEQELLARVVSDMVPPVPDPTARMRRSGSSQSFADSSDTEPTAAIGLRGIQLFVDAGIPVDTELVRNLIMEVLQEKVATMLGFPKPQEHVPAPDTQEPDEYYTEPESGSEDYSRVQTPVRTLSAASQPESHPVSHVSTPELTQSPESISSSTLDDVVGKNDVTSGHMVTNTLSDEIEEKPLEDSVHQSPIATPAVTPSPPQSVVSPLTPEESEREKPVSEEKSPVETPEITVSIRDKTSEESPKDLDVDDLKEQTFVEEDEEDQKTEADIPAIKFELEPEPSETKITNSPSSATTTTYSTHSTMGTVATDDEISEGEQLQPYVHVGQYSEGEFVAPSGVAGNMTTLHEIPDDIFDSLNASSKRQDPVKQAVHGLLKLDDVSDESTSRVSEYSHSISEGQHRMGCFAENVVQNDQSEGEVVGDVVSTLLTRIRQSVQRTRPRVGGDTTSVGEIEGACPPPISQRLPNQVGDGDEMSPGEFNSSNQDAIPNIEPIPMHHPSVLDSDENNNASEQSSSISEVQNQAWDTNIIMVTPKKATVPYSGSTNLEQSPPAHRKIATTTFPRVVHEEEARHVNTPTGFFSSPEPGSGSKDIKKLSEIDIGSRAGPVTDHVNDHATDVSNDGIPKQMRDERARIQLTLPSAEPTASVSLISEGILRSDDSAEDISSISGGEI